LRNPHTLYPSTPSPHPSLPFLYPSLARFCSCPQKNIDDLQRSYSAALSKFRAESEKLQRALEAARLELYKARDDFDSERMCVACAASARNVLLLPCRHLVLCAGCLAAMRERAARKAGGSGGGGGGADPGGVECPVCRTDVRSSLEVAGSS
jgi:hypothetical protein